MYNSDEAVKKKSNNVIETRLVCPCCHMGFIHILNEIDDRFVFPSDKGKLVVARNFPTCNRCDAKFEVLIDRTLKIEMRKIGY